MEWHLINGYPLYSSEAWNRWWYFYPPPYWYNGGWAWATPWLYLDGDKHGSYDYGTWRSKIANRMNTPAPATMAMWGNYNAVNDTGRIYVKVRNDTTTYLRGKVYFVITEDSFYYPAPNGSIWHNHAVRDFVPDQNGVNVSIAPGDSVTLNQVFAIQAGWNENRCNIITWLQDTAMQADTTIRIRQACTIKVSGMIGIVESEVNNSAGRVGFLPRPNPFALWTAVPGYENARVSVYDISGRQVGTYLGKQVGMDLLPGVYFLKPEGKDILPGRVVKIR